MDSGLYGILRYIPDPIREEPINIGVLLEVKGLLRAKWIEAAKGKLYWPVGTDLEYLRSTIDFFRSSFDVQCDMFDEAKNLRLEDIYKRWVNELQITVPRPIIVEEPNETLLRLYEAFVAVDPTQRQETVYKSTVAAQVRKCFEDFRLSQWVRHGALINLNKRPNVGFRVDHHFQNGREYVFQDFSFVSRSVEDNETDIDAWAYRCERIREEKETIGLGSFVHTSVDRGIVYERALEVLRPIECDVINIEDKDTVREYFGNLASH